MSKKEVMNNQSETMRLFVGAELCQEIKEELGRIQRVLIRQACCHGTFVNPVSSHITLAFIGEVPREEVTKIDHALRTIVTEPCQIMCTGLEVFEHRGVPKIIYISLASIGLKELAHKIQDVLKPWAKIEERIFVDHITVMRIKKIMDLEKLSEFLRTYQVQHISCVIASFMLIESQLTAQGPRYTELARYSMQENYKHK